MNPLFHRHRGVPRAARLALLGGVLIALLASAVPALAVSSAHNISFSGPGQTFGLDLAVDGTITLNGNGLIHVNEGFLSSHKDFVIPVQTHPLVMNTTLTSNPAGTATVSFDSETLANRRVGPVNVDFRNGAPWNFAFAPVFADVDVETIGNVDLRLDMTGSVTQFSFNAPPPSVSANPFFFLPGQLTLAITGTVTGIAQDVIAGIDIDLGVLTTINETEIIDIPLPGQMSLTPSGGPFPQDVGVVLAAAIPISIPLTIDTMGNVVDIQGHGSGNVDINSLDYTIDADLIFSNLNYHLESTIPNALVPEPSTLVLTALAVVGLLARRRSPCSAQEENGVCITNRQNL